jgi:hypothetical protein
MVGYRSGRHGEIWAEYTALWPRRPRTQEECIKEWLGSSDLHDLLSAMEALEKQGQEAGSLLRAIVQQDARKCRDGKRQMRQGILLVVLVALAILCWNMIYPGIAGMGAGCLLLAMWLASPCTLSWSEDYRTHRRRLSHAVALLHRIPRPNTTAEMLEALDAGDSRTAALAAKSLTQLLPRCTEAEGAELQAKHRTALRRALRGYDSDLILAILQASDKILDRAAIRDVRWLTNCPDWIAESEKIQAAARSSLASLTEISLRERTLQTLLRSSSPPAILEDELLRPATGVSAASQQMLRASDTPCPAATAENQHGPAVGLSSLSAPPCPADAPRHPFYP